MLTGYTDALSVGPGEPLQAMVSTGAGEASAEIVQIGPGAHAGGRMPEFTETVCADLGSAPGSEHRTQPGSYMVAPASRRADNAATLILRIWPTRPGGELQAVAAAGGITLVLDPDGAPALLGFDGAAIVVGTPLRAREWHLLAASRDAEGRVALHQRTISGWSRERHTVEGRGRPEAQAGQIVFAALPSGSGMSSHLDGKLADPLLLPGAVPVDGLERLGDLDVRPPFGIESVAGWNFAANPGSDTVLDRGPEALHGRLVNAPTRAVTGPRWNDSVQDWRADPDGYTAIHFHGDDLDDAAWPPQFSWEPPAGTASGLYAFRLEAGGDVDRLPFVVCPAAGAARERVAVLLPTFTYLAYANERLGREMVDPGPGWFPDLDPRDELLADHPEWGRSLYDVHDDGSGVAHSSLLRPIPNLRLEHRSWFVDAGRHLSGDLFLLHWLEREGVGFDLVTDHDLDRDGLALIEQYDVVLTGGHPEYVSSSMLDALEGFVGAGGRLMYLGGNGFYWVTDVGGERRQRIEVRRGQKGTRSWESAPGEQHQATSGEPGGLWRYRGRPPNRLTGIGFTAQGWDGRNRPYEATAAAADYPWVFAGVDGGAPIGAHGRSMGGAAGDEIDRADRDRGTPPETIVLASARGFSDAYQLIVEDVPEMHGATGGTRSPLVRADLALTPLSGGGAVFAVGSIAWSPALEDQNETTDVGRITANVLSRFLDPAPLEPGEVEARASSGSGPG